MAPRRVLCILCGGPVDNGERAPDWMGEFRVLYTLREAWTDARLSGVGQRRRLFDVIPIDESLNGLDLSEDMIDTNWVTFEPMRSTFEGNHPQPIPANPELLWGFVLHCACWELLLLIEPRTARATEVQALFDICRSHPIQGGSLNWGHDYGGLLQSQQQSSDMCPGDERQRVYHVEGAEAQYIHGPNGVRIVLDDSQSSDIGGPEPPRILPSDQANAGAQANAVNISPVGFATGTDPFRHIPHELVLNMFGHMLSQDVRAIRLASRICSNVRLDEGFWRSRFDPGQDCDYLLALVENMIQPGKWGEVYSLSRNSADMPVMANRKRIWKLCCQVIALVRLRLQSVKSEHLSAIGVTHRDSGSTWLYAHGSLAPPETLFDVGCRALFVDSFGLNGPASNICVSMVWINEKRYISGLRLTQSSGLVTMFGYDHRKWNDYPSWGEEVDSTSVHDVIGFYVALDSRGIRGLRVLCATLGPSSWVGDHEELPRRLLSYADDSQVRGIKGGFDALKMVSFAISSCPLHTHDVTQLYGNEADIWYPDVPGHEIIRSHITPAPSYWWRPFKFCFFGGERGNILEHLSSLTVVSAGPMAIAEFYGISFHYSCPATVTDARTLGRMPPATLPPPRSHDVEIFSAKGERIIGVDVSYRERGGQMLSIKFYMSTGRAVEVPPCEEYDLHWHRMRCPNNTKMVGLYCQQIYGIGLFNLGCLYARDD